MKKYKFGMFVYTINSNRYSLLTFTIGIVGSHCTEHHSAPKIYDSHL